MRRRLAATLAFLVTLLAVWLTATPAFALGAPQCDARAATTFAPPPQLQDPTSSIDLGDDGGCLSDGSYGRYALPDHAIAWDISAPDAARHATCGVAIAPASWVRAPSLRSCESPPRSTDRDALERPPRR